MNDRPLTTQPGFRDDPAGHWGRGLTTLMAVLLPVLPALNHIPVGDGRVLPLAQGIGLVVIVLAVLRFGRVSRKLARWGWVPLALLVVSGLSALLAHLGGRLVAHDMMDVWGAVAFATAVAVHYEGLPHERAGLLVAAVAAGLFASILAVGQILEMPLALALGQMLGGGGDTWQLLTRGSGPLESGAVMGWFAAVLLPLTVAAVIFLRGRQRDLAALAVALLWAGMVASYSMIAALAALAGMIAVMVSRPGMKERYPGISVAILLASLLLALHPGQRARWGPYEHPFHLQSGELGTIEGGSLGDSLRVTLRNPGPLAWSPGMELGYHIFYGEQDEAEPVIRLKRGAWIARKLADHVDAGETITVVLPFRQVAAQGFIAWDLGNRHGFLAAHRGLRYVLLYDAAAGSPDRVRALTPVTEPEILSAATNALRRDAGLVRTPDRGEVWRDAAAMIRGRPLLGLGPDGMREVVGHDARSVYLETAADLGYLGVIVFVGAGAVLLIGLIRRKTLQASALSGSLVVMVVHGLGGFVHHNLAAAAFTAMVAGLGWTVAFGRRVEGEPDV